MNVSEAIQARTSVRKYLGDPIEPDKLTKVLEAGRLAPSASNEQCWKFIVVADEDLRDQMVEACDGAKWVADAPVILVVCTTNERTMLCGQPARTVDASIALSFMMLQATELGLGTCWLGHFFANKTKQILNIPGDYSIVAVTPLGYPLNGGHPHRRMTLKDIVIHDTWTDEI